MECPFEASFEGRLISLHGAWPPSQDANLQVCVNHLTDKAAKTQGGRSQVVKTEQQPFLPSCLWQ